MTEHPLVNWWRTDSRWDDSGSGRPEDALSEGRLAIETWNEAISQAMRCVIVDENKWEALARLRELKYTQ